VGESNTKRGEKIGKDKKENIKRLVKVSSSGFRVQSFAFKV
jgi:hypothetical protein